MSIWGAAYVVGRDSPVAELLEGNVFFSPADLESLWCRLAGYWTSMHSFLQVQSDRIIGCLWFWNFVDLDGCPWRQALFDATWGGGDPSDTCRYESYRWWDQKRSIECSKPVNPIDKPPPQYYIMLYIICIDMYINICIDVCTYIYICIYIYINILV